jgi:hypothetical protein
MFNFVTKKVGSAGQIKKQNNETSNKLSQNSRMKYISDAVLR